MNSAISKGKKTAISIKIDSELKIQVQRCAKSMGISLSALLNAFMRQVVRDKQITFSMDKKDEKYYSKLIKK